MSALKEPTASLTDKELGALRQRLLRHARYAIGDEGTAEDLVQDTLIAVVGQQATHRGDATLTTWATAILKHKVADWYRSPNRRRMVPLPQDDEALGDAIDALYTAEGRYAEPVPAWQQPDGELETQQLKKTIDDCVTCLPRQTGRVFMMREWLGFETAEICERMGLSAHNTRTILYRARMSLRDCMQRHWLGKKVPA